MRIAVVVHNSVVNDSRVVKQAAALAAAGHTVEIHGITNGAPSTQAVTDLQIPVLLTEMPPLIPAQFAWGFVAIAAPITLLTFCRFLPKWAAPTSPDTLLILAACILVGVGILVLLGRPINKASRFLAKRSPLMVLYTSLWRAAVAKALLGSVSSRPPPDVAHLHDVTALLIAADLKARYGCKIVWDAHEIYESLSADSDGSMRAFLSRKMNASLIHRCSPSVDHFVTISPSLAGFYAEHYPLLGSATVVMNAVPRALRLDYDGRLHSAAGISRDRKIILYQGAFSALRGLPALVSASRHFDEQWILVMMGWGDLEPELKALASQINRATATPRIVFLPGAPHSELQMWTAGANLGCIPYENSGLNHLFCTPNKLWEYPSAGVPILCTDLIELGHAVRTHGIGVLIPRNYSETDIIAAVNSITDAELEEWRQACFKFADFENWERNALKLIKLYEKFLRV